MLWAEGEVRFVLRAKRLLLGGGPFCSCGDGRLK